MNTTRKGFGHEHDHSILASSRPEPAGQSCCGPAFSVHNPVHALEHFCSIYGF
jgi:hypothetical protein